MKVWVVTRDTDNYDSDDALCGYSTEVIAVYDDYTKIPERYIDKYNYNVDEFTLNGEVT